MNYISSTNLSLSNNASSMDMCADCGVKHQQPDNVRAGYPLCNPCYNGMLKSVDEDEAAEIEQKRIDEAERHETAELAKKEKKRKLAMIENQKKAQAVTSTRVVKKARTVKPSRSLIVSSPGLDDKFKRDNGSTGIDHIKKCVKIVLADPKQTVFQNELLEMRGRPYSPLDNNFIAAVATRVGIVGFHLSSCEEVYEQITSIVPPSSKRIADTEDDREVGVKTVIAPVEAVSPAPAPGSASTSPQIARTPRFDDNGYDINGYDARGFNRAGFNAAGYDVYGLDWHGRDTEGYDVDGFNSAGIDRDGNAKQIDNSSNNTSIDDDNDAMN